MAQFIWCYPATGDEYDRLLVNMSLVHEIYKEDDPQVSTQFIAKTYDREGWGMERFVCWRPGKRWEGRENKPFKIDECTVEY